MASSKIVGFEVSPVTDSSFDVAAQRAVVEHLAGDVVEPQALAQIVQVLRHRHGRTSKSDKLRVPRSPMRSITRSGGGCTEFDPAASA